MKKSVGHFNHNRVHIDRIKGSLISQCGTTISGTLTLSLLEALFLVERGNLVVFDEQGQEMTTSQMYNRCIKTSRDLDKYLAYGYLKRLGYVVYAFEKSHFKKPAEAGFLKWIQDFAYSIYQHVYNLLNFYSQYLLSYSKYHLTDSMVQSRISLVKRKESDLLEFPDFTVYAPNTAFGRKNRPEPSFFLFVNQPFSIGLGGFRHKLVYCTVETVNICFYNASFNP